MMIAFLIIPALPFETTKGHFGILGNKLMIDLINVNNQLFILLGFFTLPQLDTVCHHSEVKVNNKIALME